MRSGSTLLESLLFAHKDIATIGENSVFYSQLAVFNTDLVTLKTERNVYDQVQKKCEGSGDLSMKQACKNAAAPVDTRELVNKKISQHAGLVIDSMLEKAQHQVERSTKNVKYSKQVQQQLQERREVDVRGVEYAPVDVISGNALNRKKENFAIGEVDVGVESAVHTSGSSISQYADLITRSGHGFKAGTDHEKTPKILRVIDKLLVNFRRIGMIHLFFPNAVILHTMRDPMDTLVGCHKVAFRDMRMSYTKNITSLFSEYRDYFDIMRHFRQVSNAVSQSVHRTKLQEIFLLFFSAYYPKLTYHPLRNTTTRRSIVLMRKVLPGRVYDVQLEGLLRDPENVMRGVIEHLGLEWDQNVLNFNDVKRIVKTSSKLQVVRPLALGKDMQKKQK